jgi:hypothetical protein
MSFARSRTLRAASFVALIACTTVRDDLRRAEAAFSEARYEDVEAWAAELAPDVSTMTAEERAHYYYLAGMSAFRIGKRARARHALVLCREEIELGKVQLPESWSRNLHAALEQLAPPAASPPS